MLEVEPDGEALVSALFPFEAGQVLPTSSSCAADDAPAARRLDRPEAIRLL